VARASDGTMPIPSELVYAQYPRLGATGALLTRSFTSDLTSGQLAPALLALRGALSSWAARDSDALEAAREELARRAVAWREQAGRPPRIAS